MLSGHDFDITSTAVRVRTASLLIQNLSVSEIGFIYEKRSKVTATEVEGQLVKLI